MIRTTDEGLSWLNEQLRQRGIDRAELARRGSFNPAALTNVYSGKRNVGKKLAMGIATGLNLPPETVYREFGILPEKNTVDNEEAQVLADLLNDIPDVAERRRTFSLVTTLLQHIARQSKQSTPAPGRGQAGGKGNKPRRSAPAD